MKDNWLSYWYRTDEIKYSHWDVKLVNMSPHPRLIGIDYMYIDDRI